MKFRGTCLLIFLALGLNAYAQAPNLQTAGSFAVLAGGGVVSADAGTTIAGDVGSSPTPAVTGLLATQVTGTLYTAANAVLTTAQTDLTAAYVDAAGRSSCTPVAGALGEGTNANLGPGVYCFSSAALLNGTLTLTGSSTDVWIFQIGSTLTTATGATVVLAGGALPCNVFWQVGSTATIQTGNNFVGTIMALTSIVLNGGTLSGRALARNGTVTISGQETIMNACSGSSIVPSIVLSPVDSSIICGTAGSSITKSAVVLSNGLALAGTTVTFTITGPDAGQSGTANTDASGTAAFTFTTPSLTSSAGDSVVATINGGTVSSNTTNATCSDSNSTAPFPTVSLTGLTPGPPKQVVFSVQASGGLFSVVADTPPTTNAMVVISSFDTGTTQILGVTATKIDQSASAVVQLTVTDLLGHVTVFDPVYATITVPSAAVDSDSADDSDSKPASKANSKSHHAEEFNYNHREVVRFDGIGGSEGKVSLMNGTPGVESLVIRVNGSQFRARLSGGETKKIDISSALLHGTNTVTVAVFGDPGSSVDLAISGGN
jgi:Ice-binding-like